MNKSGRDRFLASLSRVLGTKEDKTEIITGILGRYNQTGSKEVDVPNRPSFVWVRLRGQDSDQVEAFNDSVGPVWGLPVKVIKDPLLPRSYRVEGRDSGKPIDWATNPLPFHGPQHSFSGSTAAGRDIAWIYKRQMVQPLLARPQSTPNMTVYVEADYYYWNGAFSRFAGASSASLTPLKPGSGLARFVLVYFDGGTGTVKLLSGSTFSALVSPADLFVLIPTISPSIGMPLAAVYLTYATTSIDWSVLYDMRIMLFTGAGGIPFAHGLDPSHGYHTGQLDAADVLVADPSGYFAYSDLEGVLINLWENDGGSLRVWTGT